MPSYSRVARFPPFTPRGESYIARIFVPNTVILRDACPVVTRRLGNALISSLPFGDKMMGNVFEMPVSGQQYNDLRCIFVNNPALGHR